MTLRELIVDALVEIGYLGADDDFDPSDVALAVRIVRRMIDRDQATRLQLFAEARAPYTLAAGQQTRTIGSGGTFNGTRPNWVSFLTVTPVGDTMELEVVPYTREEWFAEPNKTLTAEYPLRYLYERTYPLGTFTFWPIPTTAAAVTIATPTPLTALSTDDATALSTVLSLSSAYEEAWLYRLARRFHRPFLGETAPPDLREDERESVGAVLRLNDPGPPAATADAGLVGGGRFDILTGRTR